MPYNFPDQTIPESQKTETWHKEHIINFVSYAKDSAYRENKLELERLYYAYAARVHPLDGDIIKATITARYCDTNFGPAYDIYPLIENTIEQLIGDYRLRPLRMYALTQNPEAVVSKLDEKYDAYLEKIMRDVHADIEEEEGISIPTENPDIEVPENDDVDFFKNYRTKSESVAESILYFLLVIKKEKEKIYTALLHYLISGTGYMAMAEKDGHPSINIANPLCSDSDVDPNDIIQDNLQYFAYDEFLSMNDIFNTYTLTDKQKTQIKAYSTTATADNLRGVYQDNWFNRPSNNADLRIKVVSLVWKSRIKQDFKRFINSAGNEEMKILPEDYKPRKKDDIVTVEIENVRHCTMIGPDLVLEYGTQEDQLKAIGNPKKRFLHVVGINNNNKTGTNVIRSVAKKIKFLQDYASEILYEIKLAMRSVDGGVLVYDVSNIPKEWMRLGFEKAIEKVNFSVKRDRVMFINSADKRSNGYASAVNISQKSKIGDLTALLALIETIAEKISGVNGAKNGSQADYTKASVAQMNLFQANARSENIFGPFDTFVEKFLERIVLKAQHLYKKNQLINYYAGDSTLKFIEAKEEFFDDDIGVTLSDPRKEMEAKQIISQTAAQVLPNVQDPKLMVELIKVHMADSASDAIAIFERGIERMEKLAQERQQQQLQAQQQEAEAIQQQTKTDEDLTLKGYDKDITVATIYADNKLQSDQVKEANANLRKAAELEAKGKEKDQSPKRVPEKSEN